MSVALHPDHLADLQKSGLTDASIAAAHIHSVPPGELKKLGQTLAAQVAHAYVIPYHTLEGKGNGFARLKLFPRPDHALDVRYWQEPKSPVHLYMPPGPDWPKIAADATVTLTIPEGEKKGLCGCQYTLNALAVGGCWNFRVRLDDGQRIVVPELDLFVWKDRAVELCPDSDGWREGKLFDILLGFFALAMELSSRGARVHLVKLPDLPGLIKTGLDDFLPREGAGWRDAWVQLERVSLADARLYPVVKWWQTWREKQAARDALTQHTLDDLELTETAGLYAVQSRQHAVRMTFDRLTDQRGGVSAEMTVALGTTELLPAVDVGLKSDTGQTKLAGSLKIVAPSIPWKLLLQKACSLVLQRHRRGEPPTHLTKDSPVEHLTYAVNPLVFKKKTTIIYGDGGLGKSTWALFCAMVVSTGGTVAGIGAGKGRALYLDYEDDADVHIRRLHAIQCGHPALTAADILYQRCVEPLTKLVYSLVRRIHDEVITFVVLDSLMAATGGDSSAEGTAKLFAALRLLDCEVLALGHVPKTQPEGQDRTTVYGSVFNQNFARSVWELKKEQEVGEDTAILGLFNRKSNLSRLHHPIGLKVTQNDDNTRVVYEPYDLSQAAELATALPLPNRIRNLLEDGEPRSSKDIADELGAPLSSVKATLSKHRGMKWHMVGENREARWTVLNR